MKKDKLLNPALVSAIASVGHTQMLAVGDAGLPVPEGVEVIDLSVVRGVPSFTQILQAISLELVIESYIYAEECSKANPAVEKSMNDILSNLPYTQVSHEKFKELMKEVKVFVRTGECSSYANVILVAGVNF